MIRMTTKNRLQINKNILLKNSSLKLGSKYDTILKCFKDTQKPANFRIKFSCIIFNHSFRFPKCKIPLDKTILSRKQRNRTRKGLGNERAIGMMIRPNAGASGNSLRWEPKVVDDTSAIDEGRCKECHEETSASGSTSHV